MKVEEKSGERIVRALVVWSDGVVAGSFTKQIDLPRDQFERIVTNEILRVSGASGRRARAMCHVPLAGMLAYAEAIMPWPTW